MAGKFSQRLRDLVDTYSAKVENIRTRVKENEWVLRRPPSEQGGQPGGTTPNGATTHTAANGEATSPTGAVGTTAGNIGNTSSSPRIRPTGDASIESPDSEPAAAAAAAGDIHSNMLTISTDSHMDDNLAAPRTSAGQIIQTQHDNEVANDSLDEFNLKHAENVDNFDTDMKNSSSSDLSTSGKATPDAGGCMPLETKMTDGTPAAAASTSTQATDPSDVTTSLVTSEGNTIVSNSADANLKNSAAGLHNADEFNNADVPLSHADAEPANADAEARTFTEQKNLTKKGQQNEFAFEAADMNFHATATGGKLQNAATINKAVSNVDISHTVREDLPSDIKHAASDSKLVELDDYIVIESEMETGATSGTTCNEVKPDDPALNNDSENTETSKKKKSKYI